MASPAGSRGPLVLISSAAAVTIPQVPCLPAQTYSPLDSFGSLSESPLTHVTLYSSSTQFTSSPSHRFLPLSGFQ
ncbi:unnamed protein product [Pleuronectes platessa]|uniref:Uncharacterized protein n=1 Tax=Pleuronectes platessa TaxID=8262 RepID=A0A9N7UVK8_PLEPL|nr:unnamed protein product [Pleuronectes platessa]